MEEIKQYIILRKDVPTISGEPISAHKLAVMTAHASIAFLSNHILCNIPVIEEEKQWLMQNYTKVLLEAKNLDTMNKIVEKAEKEGFIEGIDFFCIRDICRVETIPDDEEDTCFIAIGFRPMEPSKLKSVVKRLRLYK